MHVYCVKNNNNGYSKPLKLHMWIFKVNGKVRTKEKNICSGICVLLGGQISQ